MVLHPLLLDHWHAGASSRLLRGQTCHLAARVWLATAVWRGGAGGERGLRIAAEEADDCLRAVGWCENSELGSKTRRQKVS